MGVQINGDTGNVIATKGTYSGNVTIGGTLTYEDVTNIDSVGLITSRTGLEIGARPGVAASISVDGNAIFSGITTVGGKLIISGNSSVKDIEYGDGTTTGYFRSNTNVNRASADAAIHLQQFRWNDTKVAEIKVLTGDDTTNKDNAHITFETASAGTTGERLRIAADGNIGIGTANPISKLDVKGAIMANGSFYHEQGGQTNGGGTQDKTVTFNARGVFLMLISFSLGTTTSEFSRNIYSLGLFTSRSNGATWTPIQQDLNSSHVGNFTISDAGSAGALRIQKSAGSDARACAFRIDVLSTANVEITVTDT